MKIKRGIFLGIAALIALNLLTVFSAIGLLSRMSPAIENILSENVQSIESVEMMLAVLGRGNDSTNGKEWREQFQQHFFRIKANITEPDEEPVVASLEGRIEAVLAGDERAVRATIEDLSLLGEINRRAMRRADEQAKRLGGAGAWACFFLGVLTVIISLVVVSRLRRHWLWPMEELASTLETVRAGDRHRRCQTSFSSPEMRQLMENINALLDKQAALESDAHRER